VSSTDIIIRHSIEWEFHRFASSRKVRIIGAATERDRESLQKLCARPEFGPFLTDTEFHLDKGIGQPFVVTEGRVINLHPDILDGHPATPVLIRHAFELCMLQRLFPGQKEPVTQLTIAALGCHTAAAYWFSLVEKEKKGARGTLPEWMTFLASQGLGSINFLMDHLLRYGSKILPLQGLEPDNMPQFGASSYARSMVRAMLTEMIALAYPTEWLLTQGGDNRLVIDPWTGLNKYGCSPKPRPWAVTFASCTGSSISDMGYGAAEKLREEIILGAFRNGLGDAILNQSEQTRRNILHFLTLDNIPGTEVVIASSGTDIELTAIYFTLEGHNDVVTNVIVAPDEVGSGTVSAASGCHFDTLSPMGSQVEVGTPVAGIATERVELVKIPVRDKAGEPISILDLDKQILEVVENAISRGGRVLLHLLDSSKTGVGAPSMETTQKIKRKHGYRVNVLVDAAQMRLSRRALRDYVKDGFIVLVTGSKFFTGPPLSGALVIPATVAQVVDGLPPLPQGFADYATSSDLPNRWRALTTHLPERPNIGLLLRWQAALWEIKAFYTVLPSVQFDTVRHFLTALIKAIDENPDLELVAAPALGRLQGDSETQWDKIQTIFSFLIKRRDRISGSSTFLSFDEAKHAYRWLNMDMSRFLPDTSGDEEKRVAGIECHIGQPVCIFAQDGTWYAALRIAVGARLISGVEFDPMLGNSREERLSTELDGALTILKKLSVISRYWDDFKVAGIEGI